MTKPDTMQRVVVSAYGGPEELRIEPMANAPRPGPGELLVDVEAAGINYLDVYQRKGIYKLPLPFSPGVEGVGRVRDVGAGVTDANGPAIGTRVAWIDAPGSYASHVVVPATRAIRMPDEFTSTQALLFQALTAEYLVTEYRDVRPGDRVLVHAAAGGVGLLLVQWLKHLGAWVVGTTSSDAKADVARAAGADRVINYGGDYAFLDELLSLTDGEGVDLAFDAVGAATLVNTLKGLARGGTAVSYGSASGAAPAIEPAMLTPRAWRLAAGSIFSYVTDTAELQRRATVVIEAMGAGWLRVSDGTAFELDRVADAHRAIEGRGTHGKLYLTP